MGLRHWPWCDAQAPPGRRAASAARPGASPGERDARRRWPSSVSKVMDRRRRRHL